MTFSLRIFALSALMLAASWSAQPQTTGQAPASPSPEAAASPAQSPSPAPADSTQLEVIKAPPPDYPLQAAAARIEGRVWIQLHISETGDVEKTEILEGHPLLATAAERAMKEWKFRPFIKDGKPVRISKKVPFDFALKVRSSDPCAAVEAALAINKKHQEWHIRQEVMDGAVIHRVEPSYPQIAKSNHIQGTVILLVDIDKEGRIQNLKVLCGVPELVPESTEAVRQWRYRPYTVEGQPVEVETSVKIQFHM